MVAPDLRSEGADDAAAGRVWATSSRARKLASGVNPFRTVATLSDEELRALMTAA